MTSSLPGSSLSGDHAARQAELSNPALDPARLAEIAQADPGLWDLVLAHPACYPGLADWIAQVRAYEAAQKSPATPRALPVSGEAVHPESVQPEPAPEPEPEPQPEPQQPAPEPEPEPEPAPQQPEPEPGPEPARPEPVLPETTTPSPELPGHPPAGPRPEPRPSRAPRSAMALVLIGAGIGAVVGAVLSVVAVLWVLPGLFGGSLG